MIRPPSIPERVKRAQPLKVLVTAGLVGSLLVGILLMRGSSGGPDEVQAVFDNVAGLVENSMVLSQGVRVGEVTRIEPEDDGGHRAVVTVVLESDADVDLRADTTMTLRLKSVLGEMFLDLDPGSDPQPLASGQVGSTHRDTSIDQLLFEGSALFQGLLGSEDLQTVLDGLRRLVDTSSGDVEVIADNARVLVAQLSDRSDALGRIIGNLDSLTLATEGRAGDLGTAIDDVNGTLETLREALVRNRDRFVSLTETVRNVVESADLQALDEALREAPGQLDLVYDALRVADAIVHADIPVFATLTATYSPNGAENGYREWETMAAANPVVRQFLIQLLRQLVGESG